MPDRLRHLFELFGTQAAAACLVLSMLAVAPDTGWPQAAPQPSLSVQQPAVQAAPDQPSPQQSEPALPPAPPHEENPGLINEIGKLFEKSK